MDQKRGNAMRKIKNKKGFTFVEMLVCVITLLMVGGICATGTGISVKSYQQSRFITDSQMLASTLDLSMGDVLRYASDIKESDGKIIFTNNYYQIEDGYMEVTDVGRIQVHKTSNPNFSNWVLALVSEKVYAEDLFVRDFTLGYADGIFSGNYTIGSNIIPEEDWKECEFTYRTIQNKNEE